MRDPVDFHLCSLRSQHPCDSRLPIAISLFSLILSIYAVVEANREPGIWLSAPDVVRIIAGRGQNAAALQSDFTITLPQDTIDRLDSRPRIWVAARTSPA